MMRDHKPISIADQVFEKLERDILSGKYPQGEILSELRLSGELGVSRTPIREAIRRLEQERILDDTGHGLVVIGISRQNMLDIYEIRLQLEGLAAKRAAASITDDVLSELKEVLDLQRFYIESEKEPGENSDQIKNLDSRFHELLYNSCGSRPYADTLISLHKKIIKYRKASVTHHSRHLRGPCRPRWGPGRGGVPAPCGKRPGQSGRHHPKGGLNHGKDIDRKADRRSSGQRQHGAGG